MIYLYTGMLVYVARIRRCVALHVEYRNTRRCNAALPPSLSLSLSFCSSAAVHTRGTCRELSPTGESK